MKGSTCYSSCCLSDAGCSVEERWRLISWFKFRMRSDKQCEDRLAVCEEADTSV